MKCNRPLIFISFLLFFSLASYAQQKIIWEITSADTSQQQVLYRQINNVLKAAPGTKIEVVFHSFAVFAMLRDTGYYKTQITDLSKRGVSFAVCNNSLKARNIDAGRVIPEAIIVPVAMLEIAKKQKKGWSYIKAGY